MAPRLTQAQKDVFALYRQGLRLIRTKPEETQRNFLIFLRHAFQHPTQGGGIRKRDFGAVDYMMRRGRKMIEAVYEERGVRDVHVSQEAYEWYKQGRFGASATHAQEEGNLQGDAKS